MFVLNGNELNPHSQFTADDIQYPGNWLQHATDDELAAVGITVLPDPAPAEPAPAADVETPLAQLKHEQVAAISEACATTIGGGFPSLALGVEHHYPFSVIDQQNLNASVLASLLPGVDEAWRTVFWCCDSDGEWAMRPHSAAQIQTVGQDAMAMKLAAIEKKIALEAQINAENSAMAIQSLTWS